MSGNGNTVTLHRVLRAPPEKVYRAFLDPKAMEKWSPPKGFLGQVHEHDAKVGGGYRMSFINFSTGSAHSFGGTYTDLTIVQENLPPEIPVEFCYLGWQESLDQLVGVVEPEIPDGG